jgi:hypothetical protein
MIQLIANLIVVTALGGSLLIVAFVVAKALIYLAAAGSTTLPDPAVVSVPHCKYCGHVFLGSEVQCDFCGAERQ